MALLPQPCSHPWENSGRLKKKKEKAEEEEEEEGREKVPRVSVGGSELFVLLRFMMGFSGEQRMENDTPPPSSPAHPSPLPSPPSLSSPPSPPPQLSLPRRNTP